jgi:hypothetical protein
MSKDHSHMFRLLRTILGLAVLLSLIVAVVGLLLGWNTPVQFSNGFFAAGAIAVVLGLFSVAGGFGQRADFSVTYAESAGQASLAERTQRMMADINQRYGALVVLVAVGLLLIAISIAIPQLF